MKTLNKKHLKIINEILFEINMAENYVSNSEKKSNLSLKDETFANYKFWKAKVLSVELYENYGISYFVETHQQSLVSQKEVLIERMNEGRKDWREAEQKVA